jgi:hypothetical protein
MTTPTQKKHIEGAPWWRYGHIWLVFGLPFAVVVASFITLYIATANPETILSTVSEGTAEESAAMVPAQSARNNAQTGGLTHSDK